MTPSTDGLAIGLSATRTLLVDESNAYSPTGKKEHSVLASPAMIMEMELACVAAVRGFVEASAGFHVDVKHIAPAPVGETVETTATLIRIDGLRLRFRVETKFGETLIGVGIHRRAIVQK